MSSIHSFHTNYEVLAPEYDSRYPLPAAMEPRGKALIALAREVEAKDILEVGCGTGYWLDGLRTVTSGTYGLDFSIGMLGKAKRRGSTLHLVQGSALDLPYESGSFDMIYCVDALHHFGDSRRFLEQAYNLLRPGGALAILGNDPHSGEVVWYGYDYFPTVLETDMKRFTPFAQLAAWMEELGAMDVSSNVVEMFNVNHRGREVYADPFLKKNASSQFALLSETDYQQGLKNIEAALQKSEAAGDTAVFEARWPARMLSAKKPQ